MPSKPKAERVRALKSFAPAGHPPVSEGDVVEMPTGADWVTCGLCEPVEAEPVSKSKPKRKTRKRASDPSDSK